MSDAVALLKESLSMSALVGRYVKLVKKGGKLAACCPFHNEKTPSFYVDDKKGFFHCFGCGKGGDLLQFAMDIEGLAFVEALDFLADIAGVELPKRRGKRGPSRDLVETLRHINDDAVQFYAGQLRKNKPAMEYLLKRGMRESTVALFKMGWAPGGFDNLFRHLAAKYDRRLLVEKSGLFKVARNGNPYDLFRERVIFPIRDVYGHPIAFGGRLIEGEGPKYINSPETPIYVKGKHVFNLDFARVFLKKKPEVVVTEGYMDAIQVYQAGVGGVIAGLGTAFTVQQAKLLKRFATRVILNFDADAAGFKAARATIETLLTIDLDIGVVSLPDKQDPDDFIKENGVAAYKEYIANARDFYTFLMEYLTGDADLETDPRQRSNVVGEMAQTLHKIADPVVQNHWLERLAEDMNLPPAVIQEVFESKRPKESKTKQREQPAEPAGTSALSAIQEQMRHAPYGGGPRRDDWKGGRQGWGKWDKKRPAGPYPEIQILHGDFSPKPALPDSVLPKSPPPEKEPAPVEARAPQPPAETPEPPPDTMPDIPHNALEEMIPVDEFGHPPPEPADFQEMTPIPEPPPDMIPDIPPDMLDEMIPVDEFGNPLIDSEMNFDPGIPDLEPKPPKEKTPPPTKAQLPSPPKPPLPKPKPPVSPEPKREIKRRVAGRTSENPFTYVEQEFLYYVMHQPRFEQDLQEDHRNMLHNILSNVFHDRHWVLEFIYHDHDLNLEETLGVVPEEMRNHLRAIYFEEAFESFYKNEDINRLEQLFPELMAKMLQTLTERNKQRLRLLPPTEIKKKQALLKQNNEWRKQMHMLRNVR
ncbi:MAG: DNA primase [Acidobacteriota bacterium]|nr:DNA primase [Acidobacteriota bacterium]